jgi:type IV secretory pathway TraG/TraD family ATPase VirD4
MRRADGAVQPLAHIRRIDDTEVVNELQKIAGMLFPAPERSDPFWAEAARAAFVGVGALVAFNPGLPFTIGEIYRRLTTGDPKSDLPAALQEARRVGQRLSQACVSAIQDFTSASDNTFSGIKQTITARLNLWLNPMVDAATSESDFDLREVRRRRMSIYLGVSPDNIDRIAPIYSLFLQQLVDLNTRDLPEDASNVPVLVLLDEFARLGKASVIASGFSYVAGYGLRLVPVIQSRSQLRAIYGPDVTDEIIANCGLEVVFTPKELKVANELSERLGFFTMNVKSRSRTIHGLLANRSISDLINAARSYCRKSSCSCRRTSSCSFAPASPNSRAQDRLLPDAPLHAAGGCSACAVRPSNRGNAFPTCAGFSGAGRWHTRSERRPTATGDKLGRDHTGGNCDAGNDRRRASRCGRNHR